MGNDWGYDIFISHRIDYQGTMYWDVCTMLNRAVEYGSIPSWRNMSLPPHRDLEKQLNRKVPDSELLDMVKNRTVQSSAVIVVNRKAASYGKFVIDELETAVNSNTPIIAMEHPSYPTQSGLLPWDSGLVISSAWRYDSLAAALYSSRHG